MSDFQRNRDNLNADCKDDPKINCQAKRTFHITACLTWKGITGDTICTSGFEETITRVPDICTIVGWLH